MSISLVDTLSGHSGRVWSARWNPSGNILASCGEDRNIRLWTKCGSHWKTKTILQDGHSKTVRQLAWSPNGKALASASFDATTAIWDTSNGSDFDCTATLEGHESEVKSVSWSHSGDYLATCSRDKSVWVWEVEGEEYECAAVLNAHTQDVKRVVWHPSQDLLASASYDNTVKLFREDPSDNEWTVAGTLKGHESTVWAVAFSHTGEYLATGSDDSTVRIWREYLPGNKQGVPTEDKQPTWKCVSTLSGYHSRPVYDLAWSSSGFLATACSDNSIHIFQEAPSSDPDQPIFDLLCVKHNAHDQDVNSVDWHPTETNLLASSGDDSSVKIWAVSVS